MTVIHLDAVGGASGDMFIAAMLDAVPDLAERVMQDAAAVLPSEVGHVVLEASVNGGISGKRFSVDIHGERRRDGNTFRAMMETIAAAPLHPGTRERASAILTILAEAEAAIHAVAVGDVHFHELADWDSLVDTVCAGSIAAALEGARWTVSSLPRGSGLVETAHGLLPVPAPATAAILTGFDWRDDGIGGERVTPTGAAILRHLAAAPATPAAGRLRATGTGTGTRRLDGIANILRALVFDAGASGGHGETVCVIGFDIDDMTGEEIGVAADRLRGTPGVLDVTIGQRFGKKGRPVQAFRVLAAPDQRETVIARCFSETSTIGLRVRVEERRVLERRSVEADGVAVKLVDRPGGRTAKAESDAVSHGATLEERRAMKGRAERSDG